MAAQCNGAMATTRAPQSTRVASVDGRSSRRGTHLGSAELRPVRTPRRISVSWVKWAINTPSASVFSLRRRRRRLQCCGCARFRRLVYHVGWFNTRVWCRRVQTNANDSNRVVLSAAVRLLLPACSRRRQRAGRLRRTHHASANARCPAISFDRDDHQLCRRICSAIIATTTTASGDTGTEASRCAQSAAAHADFEDRAARQAAAPGPHFAVRGLAPRSVQRGVQRYTATSRSHVFSRPLALAQRRV